MSVFARIFIVLIVGAGLAGCSSDLPSGQDAAAIQVNKTRISKSEFNELLKFEAWADPEMEVTDEARDQFVDYLIRKELMIQEAARLELDREPGFVRTIEKYWEATLIRNLLDQKSGELKKNILVTEDEIRAYYAAHKDDYEQPFEAVRAGIKKIIEANAVQKGLEQWYADMKSRADINVDKSLLKKSASDGS